MVSFAKAGTVLGGQRELMFKRRGCSQLRARCPPELVHVETGPAPRWPGCAPRALPGVWRLWGAPSSAFPACAAPCAERLGRCGAKPGHAQGFRRLSTKPNQNREIPLISFTHRARWQYFGCITLNKTQNAHSLSMLLFAFFFFFLLWLLENLPSCTRLALYFLWAALLSPC